MSSIVTLADVKRHLRYPNPSAPHADDAALLDFIEAADPVIRYECDDILPEAYTEQHDGGDFRIYLFNRPLLSVQGIQESWGWISYDLDYQQAGVAPGSTSMFGYSIDNAEVSEVSRRTMASVLIPFVPGSNNITVQYTAGIQPIPGNIILATKELIAHWWRNSQQRSGSSGAGAPNEAAFDSVEGAAYSRDPGTQNINIGVPFRIIQLIKGNRRMPFMA